MERSIPQQHEVQQAQAARALRVNGSAPGQHRFEGRTLRMHIAELGAPCRSDNNSDYDERVDGTAAGAECVVRCHGSWTRFRAKAQGPLRWEKR